MKTDGKRAFKKFQTLETAAPAFSKPWKSRSGLTLIEVMLALTILGIGVAGLVVAAGRCIAVIRKSQHYEMTRQLFGRVDLEDPLILRDEIEEGSESGSFDGGPEGYRWKRDIKMVGEEEDGLFQVTTIIQWSDAGKQAQDEVVSYLFSPEVIKRGQTGGAP